MTPPDDEYSYGFTTPLAIRIEKVGLVTIAVMLAVVLFVLFVLRPSNPVPLYITLVTCVALLVTGAVRLRNMLRRQRGGRQ